MRSYSLREITSKASSSLSQWILLLSSGHRNTRHSQMTDLFHLYHPNKLYGESPVEIFHSFTEFSPDNTLEVIAANRLPSWLKRILSACASYPIFR